MKKNKVLSMLLVLSMTLGLAACGNSKNSGSTEGTEAAASSSSSSESEISMPSGYDDTSKEVYDAALGDFYEAYQKVDDASSLSERYALDALAEAKLLEAAVWVPTSAKGGSYNISRVDEKSKPNVLWGNDNERFHNVLVTKELIKNSDRDTMKAKWAELKGTGTYRQWAADYLTSQGYTLKDSYTYPYNADPVTWDANNTSLAADSEQIINTYDGLLEYDCEGVAQPALAEALPTVSEDGLTYTFKIRQGVKWVDSQGRELGEVTANDFVAGLQHTLDCQAGLEYLVQGVIKGADEYIKGEITDFSQVGVKAVDDYTLEYTLVEPTPYFDTMFGYGVFAPLCKSYYESLGGKFGVEFDSSASDYTYGKDANSIAYCGPYLVTSTTEKNSIVFDANTSYWNYDNLPIKKITRLWNDGSDATKGYKDIASETCDSTMAGLSTSSVELAKGEGNFDDYAYVLDNDGTSYGAFVNLNRTAYYNFNDKNAGKSSQTDDIKEATNKAVNNVHFRRAILFAFDRTSYNGCATGDDIAAFSLRNSYTPGNFLSLTEDVTVDVNGTATTFPAGTYYGEITQAQLDADGVAIKAYDKTADNGLGSSDGYEGWYNVDNAKAELNQAVEELKAEGLEISAENPIHLDLPYPSGAEVYSNKANVFKKSVEEALGGLVEIDLVDCKDQTTWLYTGYYTSYGYENNYDLFDLSGWAPDYGDPKSYLDTFLPDYAGYVTKSLGIY